MSEDLLNLIRAQNLTSHISISSSKYFAYFSGLTDINIYEKEHAIEVLMTIFLGRQLDS